MIKSGPCFSFVLLERFLFVLLFVGKACLVGLSLFSLSFFFFWSCRYDCQVLLSSENTLKQIVLFPCAEQSSELQVINFIDTVWKKNVDESSRMWKDGNFKVPNTEWRKISEVVSLSKEIHCVGICKRKVCSRMLQGGCGSWVLPSEEEKFLNFS